MTAKFKKMTSATLLAIALFSAYPARRSEAFVVPAVVGTAFAVITVSEKTAMLVGAACDAVSIVITGYRAKKGTLGE